MPFSDAELSDANPQFGRDVQSSNSPKQSHALSPSSDIEILDLGLDPTTLLTANILHRPSSLKQLCDHIDILKGELVSEDPPRSQYLLVRQVPNHLFSVLVKDGDDSEFPKGVRATVLYNKHQILYRIMVGHYHEKIIRQFDTWINLTLGHMGLSFVDYDFWLGGAGRSDGRMCSKEGDTTFFPGREPAAGAPMPWPSLVLEVGISESVPQLRTDARWWYSNSNHQTKLVVIISAKPNSRDADIEIWTEVVNQSVVPTTRGRETHVLECTRSATLRDGVVSGNVLIIDFQTLMGRPPQNPQETDLQLTPRWIQRMCE
ncbi:hypothetical protein N7516_002177 [Penicillium verrucosum]|uniref:uncharacterized protein n=1 Tax=Penicillium verrucosum TaxID=60171 RepID=UPI0025454AC7|nr:uncharacterized protein N7516_002177 [Penicillium verrucosum]KAJ5942009.1 hypothetical protein N7516_002177 [Penicillium verrucosum]